LNMKALSYNIHSISAINRSLLKKINLLKSKIKNETVYGNIGQDIIRQFSKMTLNFKDMFIHFN
jgi:hypothetical protein